MVVLGPLLRIVDSNCAFVNFDNLAHTHRREATATLLGCRCLCLICCYDYDKRMVDA